MPSKEIAPLAVMGFEYRERAKKKRKEKPPHMVMKCWVYDLPLRVSKGGGESRTLVMIRKNHFP